jgi:DNA-binding transcriptional LysR family regulator
LGSFRIGWRCSLTDGVNSAYLGPIISDYLKRYPEVRLELFCTGRPVDLVEERFDVGIRAGVLADTTLVARKLGTLSWCLVATAAYLRKRARPRLPRDLERHELLAFGAGSTSVQLRLERAGRTEQIAIATRLLVGDSTSCTRLRSRRSALRTCLRFIARRMCVPAASNVCCRIGPCLRRRCTSCIRRAVISRRT